MKIFEEVVTVKLRESFTRPLHSSTRTSCTDKQSISQLLILLNIDVIDQDTEAKNSSRI